MSNLMKIVKSSNTLARSNSFDFEANDHWPAEELGLKPDSAHSSYYLQFKRIKPLWLNHAVKKFVRLQATTKSFSSCKSYTVALSHFAEFLGIKFEPLPPSNIVTRGLVIEYLNYLADIGIAIATRRTAIIHLRTFHQFVLQEHWLPWPVEPLIFSSDIPKEVEKMPRYIPEDIIHQLKMSLRYLPQYLQRLILILLETGRRVSEICTLPLYCTEQDDDGDWFLQVIEQKFKKSYLIPISETCIDLIQAQQMEVVNKSNEHAAYLFPAVKSIKSQHITARNLNESLNQLANRYKIKDANGKIWHFHAHQFRHTVGTRMINAGVSQCIVQRFLGHESPDMTSRYAYIHDSTLKKAFLEYHDNFVDIHGHVGDIANDYDEAKWLKSNIMAQALPNGLCALPSAQQRCPHANACLTCGNFRTHKQYLPQHEEQLKQTEALIETAKCHGWQRQLEMNTTVKTNLENIINKLKEECK